jgi:hypothetical protein
LPEAAVVALRGQTETLDATSPAEVAAVAQAAAMAAITWIGVAGFLNTMEAALAAVLVLLEQTVRLMLAVAAVEFFPVQEGQEILVVVVAAVRAAAQGLRQAGLLTLLAVMTQPGDLRLVAVVVVGARLAAPQSLLGLGLAAKQSTLMVSRLHGYQVTQPAYMEQYRDFSY